MNGGDLLRLVDAMHREKNISKEIIFKGIEDAVQLAAVKHYGEDEDIEVAIDRGSGVIKAHRGQKMIEPELLGRIAAQSAKQLIIQKIREAECNATYDEYITMKSELVHGAVQRFEGGAALLSLGKTEALLPRSEQIPGETHHVGERVKAVILDVRKVGQRVKIILSRTHGDFVRRLFENEIPEIADHTIEVKALAREAGYRTKIAVSSIDTKVDCVGACVGVRGSRIKNITDELGGERIDIVRWNDSVQVMIPNALQPASIEEVFLYPRLGRAIVLVKEDQLSLAIGRRGQNVRLASKLIHWDIEIMTHDELNREIERAENWFRAVPGLSDDLVESFIEEGFLSYNDLTFLDPAELAELAGIDEQVAAEVIDFAEAAAEQVEEDTRGGRGDGEHRSGGGRPRPADIFPSEVPTQSREAKPTLESLFGPDIAVKPEREATISAEQLFGDLPPAQPEPQPVAEDSVAEEPSPGPQEYETDHPGFQESSADLAPTGLAPAPEEGHETTEHGDADIPTELPTEEHEPATIPEHGHGG